MKKVFLVSVLIVSFISNAQIHNVSGNIKSKSTFVFTNEDYIGYWVSELGDQLFIWKDSNNNMQLVEFSNVNCAPFEIISLNFNKTNLYIKMNFKKNNWTTESELTFVDKTTLTSTVTGDGTGTVTYTKVK